MGGFICNSLSYFITAKISFACNLLSARKGTQGNDTVDLTSLIFSNVVFKTLSFSMGQNLVLKEKMRDRLFEIQQQKINYRYSKITDKVENAVFVMVHLIC